MGGFRGRKAILLVFWVILRVEWTSLGRGRGWWLGSFGEVDVYLVMRAILLWIELVLVLEHFRLVRESNLCFYHSQVHIAFSMVMKRRGDGLGWL